MKNRQSSDLGLLILRIAIGGLMLLHGIAKIKTPSQTIDYLKGAMTEAGLPAFFSYGVFLGEFIAPLLVLIGWRTRLFAPIISFTMFIAIYTKHAADVFALTNNGGWAVELQGLYLLGGLALFFTGAGRFALSYKSQWD